MTEELYLKAKKLQDKIAKLTAQKCQLSKKTIINITTRKDSYFRPTSFGHIDCEFLDSIKLRDFILNEINEKLSKLQKEFNEL